MYSILYKYKVYIVYYICIYVLAKAQVLIFFRNKAMTLENQNHYYYQLLKTHEFKFLLQKFLWLK